MRLLGKGAGDEAAEALSLRAAKGDAEAQNALGLVYEAGFPSRELESDLHVRAAALFKAAAAARHADGMYNYGRACELGLGRVPISYGEALTWYKSAARAGSVAGMNAAGTMYFKGLGVERDTRKAHAYFEQAVNFTETSAGNGSGGGRTPLVPPEALNSLGVMHEEGISPVRRDLTKALEFYERAGALGLALASYNAGYVLLSLGRKDEALATLRAACRQGSADAHFCLGIMLRDGAGIARDLDRAKEHLLAACVRGGPLDAYTGLAALLVADEPPKLDALDRAETLLRIAA
jgi:TPR repeat protein